MRSPVKKRRNITWSRAECKYFGSFLRGLGGGADCRRREVGDETVYPDVVRRDGESVATFSKQYPPHCSAWSFEEVLAFQVHEKEANMTKRHGEQRLRI